MAAINTLITRDSVAHQLAKRNWAAQEPGVITVFCIVGVVGIGLIGLWVYKCSQRRSANKASVV